jgi:hypothetical protein
MQPERVLVDGVRVHTVTDPELRASSAILHATHSSSTKA